MNNNHFTFAGESVCRGIAVAAAFVILTAFAPNLSAQWAWAVGEARPDESLSVIRAADGGCVFGGFSTPSDRMDKDFWVVKLSPGGKMQWQKSIRMPAAYVEIGDDQAAAVWPSADGGYIVGGCIHHLGRGSSPPDIFILRLSSTGTVLWEYGIPEENPYLHSFEQILSVCSGPGGTFIAAGTQSVFPAPDGQGSGDDACFVSFSADGKILWKRNLGGAGEDVIYCIRPAKGGGFFAAGSTTSYGAGKHDAWLLRIDSSGRPLWQKTYGGSKDDYARSIESTKDGGCVLAGMTESFGSGGPDAWVIKLDVRGAVQWQKTLGGSAGDYANDIGQTADGGFMIAGSTGSFGRGTDFWLFKTNSSGVVEWQKAFGGVWNESAFSIDILPGGGCYAAGRTRSFGSGKSDALILKTDKNGSVGSACPSLVRITKAKQKASHAIVTTSLPEYRMGRIHEDGPEHWPFLSTRTYMKKPCP